MWVSWWTKRGLGRFSSGFLHFSHTTNFIPPFLHTHLIHFVTFYFIRPCDGGSRRGQPTPLLFTDLQGLHYISFLDPALYRTQVDEGLIYFNYHFIRPCDCASGVVGRHPCYSRTYNIGASLHLIPRPDLVLDTS